MTQTHELEIEISGRVQGIMLRNKITKEAKNLALQGTVENKEDGTVKIIIQGEEQTLKNFLSWIQSNPGFSKIKQMHYFWKTPAINYKNFSIIKKNTYIIDKAKSVLNLGKSFFKKQQETIPKHIAIIPDGNRRWAKQRGLEATYGHYKSGNFENIESLMREAQRIGVKYFTIWGFSTENWKRSEKEREAVFEVITKIIDHFTEQAKEYKIKFNHIGRKDRLPQELVQKLKNLEETTKNFEDFHVQLCLDYGGRDEVVRAMQKAKGQIMNEETFPKLLDTSDIPDPDLIIRTGGEHRLSGFLPFQSTYSELYFTDIFFPEFDAKELRKAVKEFAERQRRFGA